MGFFFSSRRRHTRWPRDWSSDVCSSDLVLVNVFHIGVDRGKTFTKTWDHFLLPMPFARTVILFARPIYVPADANADLMDAKHAEMQRERSEERRVGKE